MRTHSRILWSRLFRRCAAFFLATLAVWALLAGTSWGLAAGSLDALSASPLYVSAALQAELGSVETGTVMMTRIKVFFNACKKYGSWST